MIMVNITIVDLFLIILQSRNFLIFDSLLSCTDTYVCNFSTGAWCTNVVKQGSLFGPFKGEIVKENERKKIDFRYAWEVRIYDVD